MKIDIVSVVPSPYQRDLFRALALEQSCELRVHYLEHTTPDSPWPEPRLAGYESVLPGCTAGRGRVRCHANWTLPDFTGTDVAMVNASLTALTTQQLMQRLHRQGVPWVFWGEILQRRSGWKGFVQQALTTRLRGAAAIVAIGSAARDDYQRRFPSKPVYDLPYHCELAAFAAASKARSLPNPEPVFLFCGQMIHRKGIDVLLDAFHGALQRGLRARLLLAGREGELPTLLRTLPQQTRERIDYAGFVAPEALPALFAKADVFVLPSRHDGWGVVVNQALGAGLPIIASDAVGAARDLVAEGINGCVLPAGNTALLIDALQLLGTRHDLRAAMAAGSASRGASLTPRHGARAFRAILEETLASTVALPA